MDWTTYGKHTMRSLTLSILVLLGTISCGGAMTLPSERSAANVRPREVIVLMGASCSGKSTLAARLIQSLGEDWRLVELDAIEDDVKAQRKERGLPSSVSDTELRNLLAARVNQASLSSKIVVDTNLFDEILERQISGRFVYKVLVYAPLDVLLDRDRQRTQTLARSAEQAKRAREYVIETFRRFEKFDTPSFYNLKIDTAIRSRDEALRDLLTWYSRHRAPQVEVSTQLPGKFTSPQN